MNLQNLLADYAYIDKKYHLFSNWENQILFFGFGYELSKIFLLWEDTTAK